MIKIRVLFFARAKDLTGCGEFEAALESPATIRELRASLAMRFPPLISLLAGCRLARNRELGTDETPLSQGDEVAILPPVSGG